MAILSPTFEEVLHSDKVAPEIRKGALKLKSNDRLDPIDRSRQAVGHRPQPLQRESPQLGRELR
jgi:hypothetical protein